MNRAILFVLCFGIPLPAWAQSSTAGQSVLPPLLAQEREIELALSAVPAPLASAAAVYVLRRGGYVRVREGSNGFSCLVERDHPESIAPICYDAEASETILPGVLHLTELRESGKSYDEAKREVDEGYRTGRFRAPRRPAMSYMLSREQVLYSSPNGTHVGAWFPHVMIFSPYLTNAAIGGGEAGIPSIPFVADEGLSTSHIIVVVREWSGPSQAAVAHRP